MGSKTSQIAERIRDRLGERVLAGVPQWLAPVLPAARNNAGALLVGNMTGKLPAEDTSALVRTILTEQNSDGSWSPSPGAAGDLSLTLEVVEALSTSGDNSARQALSKAVSWLESHHDRIKLREDTLILLSSLTDMLPRRMNRLMMPVVRMFLLSRARKRLGYAPGSILPIALSILSRERGHSVNRASSLLESQLPDGSWAGAARDTVFALIALRHASLPCSDPAFERGWRFLCNLQVWNDDGLVQNPCDVSNFIHAAAARTLLTTGGDSDTAAGSTLSLLHQARISGGWAVGGSLPTDLFTTANALDALSFAGDVPVETSWVRRRTVLLLLRTQRSDGGWPAYATTGTRWQDTLVYRGSTRRDLSSVDVTAVVVQALVFSGVQERGMETAIRRGLRFLLRHEHGGIWRGDVFHSSIFSTARSLEAIVAVSGEIGSSAAWRAVNALTKRQNSDGGWSENSGQPSTVLHTAWVLRGLTGIPGVASEVLQRGRLFLEQNLDPSQLVWAAGAPELTLPLGLGKGSVNDLTTIFALEALIPVGIPARTRATDGNRTRSLFHRNS
jgi:squalene cyclase